MFLFETDHTPLLPLRGRHPIDSLLPKIQRFGMRLLWYSYNMTHVPGTSIDTADTLFRARYMDQLQRDVTRTDAEVAPFPVWYLQAPPATESLMEKLGRDQEGNPECAALFSMGQTT